MSSEDARFYGWLAFGFGAAFVAGGRLAAFTVVGLVLMLAGTAMLLAAPLLLKSARVGVASLIVAVALWNVPLSLLP